MYFCTSNAGVNTCIQVSILRCQYLYFCTSNASKVSTRDPRNLSPGVWSSSGEADPLRKSTSKASKVSTRGPRTSGTHFTCFTCTLCEKTHIGDVEKGLCGLLVLHELATSRCRCVKLARVTVCQDVLLQLKVPFGCRRLSAHVPLSRALVVAAHWYST